MDPGPSASSHPGHAQSTENKSNSLVKHLLEELISDIVLDIVGDEHRRAHTRRTLKKLTGGQDRAALVANAGKKEEMYECINCGRMTSCNRYAPHLSGCVGLTGNGSTRRRNQPNYNLNRPKQKRAYNSDENGTQTAKKIKLTSNSATASMHSSVASLQAEARSSSLPILKADSPLKKEQLGSLDDRPDSDSDSDMSDTMASHAPVQRTTAKAASSLKKPILSDSSDDDDDYEDD